MGPYQAWPSNSGTQASWLGMQVTQWVANATIWCLSPPNDLTSHAWLGHRDSQLVTSITHGSSPQPTGRGWQNHSSEGFSPWPPISQLGTFWQKHIAGELRGWVRTPTHLLSLGKLLGLVIVLVYTCICVHMYTCVCMCISVCVSVCMCVYTCVLVCMCAYTCVLVCVCVCTHVC